MHYICKGSPLQLTFSWISEVDWASQKATVATSFRMGISTEQSLPSRRATRGRLCMGPLGMGPRMDPESILGLFPGCIMFAFRLSIRLKRKSLNSDILQIPQFICRDWNLLFVANFRKVSKCSRWLRRRFVVQFFQQECNSIQILVSVVWLEMQRDAPEGAGNALLVED